MIQAFCAHSYGGIKMWLHGEYRGKWWYFFFVTDGLQLLACGRLKVNFFNNVTNVNIIHHTDVDLKYIKLMCQTDYFLSVHNVLYLIEI